MLLNKAPQIDFRVLARQSVFPNNSQSLLYRLVLAPGLVFYLLPLCLLKSLVPGLQYLRIRRNETDTRRMT